MRAIRISLIFTVLMMSLLVTIPSGSFFLSQYLSSKILLNEVSESEISYGVKLGFEEAIKYRYLQINEQSKEWFHLAKILAETDKNIAFKLAVIYHIEEDILQATYWYRRAVELKHLKAKQELIDLYISEKKLILAKELLLPLKADITALNKLMVIAVTLGDKKLIEDLIPTIIKQPNHKILDQLKRYKIVFSEHDVSTITCENSIQFFATRLKDLNTLDKLIKGIKNHPLSQYFCFETPRYLSPQQLDCDFNPDKAIRCNSTMWSYLQPEIQTRYIGLMLSKGGANVDNGIMYLDAVDTEDVFIHELSHLLGFVDEYTLPKHHKVCQNEQENILSHNISILKPFYSGSRAEVLGILAKQVPWFNNIDKQTPLLKKVGNKWKVGTPSAYLFKSDTKNKEALGLFKAETCKNTEMIAFKPTRNKTNLHYYEEPFIEPYVSFLKANPDGFLMPSYHYNVAKSLFKSNQEVLGFQWLKKALDRESNNKNEYQRNRYNKVKLGKY